MDDSWHNYAIIKDDNDESNVEIVGESTETGCEVHNKIFASKHKHELKDYANIDLENEWASFNIMRNKIVSWRKQRHQQMVTVVFIPFLNRCSTAKDYFFAHTQTCCNNKKITLATCMQKVVLIILTKIIILITFTGWGITMIMMIN